MVDKLKIIDGQTNLCYIKNLVRYVYRLHMKNVKKITAYLYISMF